MQNLKILISCLLLLFFFLHPKFVASTDTNVSNLYSKDYSYRKVSKELILFDIYWMGIYVGQASLEIRQEGDSLKITSKVNSAPIISTIYKVDDLAISELIRGKPSHFKIKQHEGKYRSNKETFFDFVNMKILYLNHLKGERHEHSLSGGVFWDIISGFYHSRSYPFETGKTYYISIFDSNKFYSAEIKVIGKEKIKISDGLSIDAIIIKPILQSEGLFRKKGDILIWLSDDEKRIPLKVETSVSIGKVIAKIRYLDVAN
ncbi:MAG: DUF3108 domain-containing protein [Thermodesulfovibrionales bacterium]|nr:DUF3108 domain-containing protein [Thermodesulfovibrionales bacterium]